MYSSTVSLTSVLDRGGLLITHSSHPTGYGVGLGICSGQVQNRPACSNSYTQYTIPAPI